MFQHIRHRSLKHKNKLTHRLLMCQLYDPSRHLIENQVTFHVLLQKPKKGLILLNCKEAPLF